MLTTTRFRSSAPFASFVPEAACAFAFAVLVLGNEVTYALLAHLISEATQNKSPANDALARYRLGMHFAISLTLCCVLFILHQKRRQLTQKRASIRALEQERASLESVVASRTMKLSELATHLQDAREAERRHLARELHDEMGAMFTTAKLDVARIRGRFKEMPSEAQVRLDHLVETLNTGIALKRRIIEELRPSSLANLGLSTTLETYLCELSARSSLHIRFFIDPPKLSERGELTVFRLVQESLTNVIKHASAQTVVVSVRQCDANVRVAIEDDGVGFDRAQIKPNTYGLNGMAHRVEVPGGNFEIRSKPGVGTSVIASFPISMR